MSGLRRALAERRDSLNGKLASASAIADLRSRFPVELPGWLTACLSQDHVIGVQFEDPIDRDITFMWLSPERMIAEATQAYPGIAVAELGYLPLGGCLLGSGDPYFLQFDGTDDPPLVRVYHDCIDKDGRVFGHWREVIADHVGGFVQKALIG